MRLIHESKRRDDDPDPLELLWIREQSNAVGWKCPTCGGKFRHVEFELRCTACNTVISWIDYKIDARERLLIIDTAVLFLRSGGDVENAKEMSINLWMPTNPRLEDVLPLSHAHCMVRHLIEHAIEWRPADVGESDNVIKHLEFHKNGILGNLGEAA